MLDPVTCIPEVSAETVLRAVSKAGFYGVEAQPIVPEARYSCLVIALNNADLDGMLDVLFARNPKGVLLGAKALCQALQISDVMVYTRTAAAAGAVTAAATEMGMTVAVETTDVVNVRQYRDALLIHPETLAAAADLLCGVVPGVVLSINGGEPVEVPFGTPIAGLIPSGKGLLVDNSLTTAAALGDTVTAALAATNGVITVITENQCAVQTALMQMHHMRARTCGKCTFCREGINQLTAIIGDVTNKRVRPSDTGLLEELCSAMPALTNCSLGRCASLPVSTLMKSFEAEWRDHVQGKACAAEACKAFIVYYVDSAKCSGCGKCEAVCKRDVISRKPGFTAEIESFGCNMCGDCMTVCPEGAICKAPTSKRIVQKTVRVSGGAVPVEEAAAPAAPKAAPVMMSRRRRR